MAKLPDPTFKMADFTDRHLNTIARAVKLYGGALALSDGNVYGCPTEKDAQLLSAQKRRQYMDCYLIVKYAYITVDNFPEDIDEFKKMLAEFESQADLANIEKVKKNTKPTTFTDSEIADFRASLRKNDPVKDKFMAMTVKQMSEYASGLGLSEEELKALPKTKTELASMLADLEKQSENN